MKNLFYGFGTGMILSFFKYKNLFVLSLGLYCLCAGVYTHIMEILKVREKRIEELKSKIKEMK